MPDPAIALFNALLLLLCVIRTDSAGKQKDELQIMVEHKPEVCVTVAEVGDQVSIHYTGMLENGKVFDSSVQQERDPIAFQLGKGNVIKGWEQGIHGMCVGEKRKLIIPPHLGYGKEGYPPIIPADATLVFETELMTLMKGSGEGGGGGESTTGIGNFAIFEYLRFLAVPALFFYVIYYLIGKYKQESEQQKNLKKEKKKRK